MSIEYYVQGFTGGEPDGVPLRQALKAFGGALSQGEGGRYLLFFDDRTSANCRWR